MQGEGTLYALWDSVYRFCNPFSHTQATLSKGLESLAEGKFSSVSVQKHVTGQCTLCLIS